MRRESRKVETTLPAATDNTVLARLTALKRMSVRELKAEWKSL